MQIQVNTSNGIENKETLERWADEQIRQHLDRFANDVDVITYEFENVPAAVGVPVIEPLKAVAANVAAPVASVTDWVTTNCIRLAEPL